MPDYWQKGPDPVKHRIPRSVTFHRSPPRDASNGLRTRTEHKGGEASRGRLPAGYQAWLAAALVSRVGDAALYFALGWAASAHGGRAAGQVITAIVAPRTLLLLVGGAVGDRIGARPIMIIGDAVLLVATCGLAVAVPLVGTPLWLLLASASALGTVTAFYFPAAGAMPRRLVDGAQLPRALALRQAGSQLADLTGGPLGGLLVGVAGLAATAGLDAVSYAVVLVALVAVRPTRPAPRETGRASLTREAASGVRMAFADPVLRVMLLLAAVAAGAVLPASSLLLPLLLRHHGWRPAVGGLTLGAQSLGGVVVALAVSRFGTRRRAGRVAAAGLMVTAGGVGLLAVAPSPAPAVAAGAVLGAGVGLFTSHMAPLMFSSAPDTHLSRVQAVLNIVQSTALVVTTPTLGVAAQRFGAPIATAACAAVVLVAAFIAAASPSLRNLDTEGPDPSIVQRTTKGP
ncbi:MAG: MFS transporter [Frankia sp.]